MKKVMITGGSGFIAGHLAALLEKYPEKYSVTRVSLRGGADDIDFKGYDCVVHTAGIAHVRSRNVADADYMAVNRDLTVAAARAAKVAGVGQFIYLSSIIVYGPEGAAGETRVITSLTEPEPENAYGRSKLDAETGIRALSGDGFDVAILRLPMVYGEGCRGNYALLKKYARYIPVFPALCGERSAVAVEALAGFIRDRIDAGDGGTFFPQDARPAGTFEMLKRLRAEAGKGTYAVRIFDPLIRLFKNVRAVKHVLGGIAYSPDIADICGNENRSEEEK